MVQARISNDKSASRQQCKTDEKRVYCDVDAALQLRVDVFFVGAFLE